MGIHDDIRQEREASTPEAEKLKLYRRYARGRQDGTLSAQQRKILGNLIGKRFCDNVVARILGELRNRLRLKRMEVDGETGESDRVQSYLRQLWTLNNVSRMANAIHWAMLRDGDHAVSLNHITTEAGEDRVVLRRELWWNGTVGTWVAYDDNGRPKYAVKDWEEDGTQYRTIYERARIRRFRRGGSGWTPYSLDSDPDAGGEGTVIWTDDGTAGGEPIGIPVVHFGNLQVPQDPEGGTSDDEPDPMYGSSELGGGLLGLQDEVNDVHRDITAAARFSGYPMMYGTGVGQPTDNDGNPTSYTPEPGAFFRADNPDAEFGRIEAGSIETLVNTLETKLEAMSRQSSVPMFAIQGDWPSGEALIRAEMPLVDKVETIADSVGPAWGSVMHKATRLHNVFSGGTLNEDLMISAVFGDPRRRDEATQAEVAEKVAPFVSERETLRILDYSPSEIDRIMDERSEERQQRRNDDIDVVRRMAEGVEGREGTRQSIEEGAETGGE